MNEPLPRESATNADGLLPGFQGLTLDERAKIGVWMIQTVSASQLSRFSDCLVGSALGIGEMAEMGGLRLVRHGPCAAYLFFDVENIPTLQSSSNEWVTDISHGLCELNLKGENALLFLTDYTSANLDDRLVCRSRTVRTRVGHFKVLLWWSEVTDVHILVDRSLAQALYDYLLALAARWSITRSSSFSIQK